MSYKIINILHHPPAYENYRNSPRPEISWDTPGGEWVGIWGYDWPNQLGNEVLKLTDDFTYEVWQPDLRADRIYSHQFDNGLIHKIFPAEERRQIVGLKSQEFVYSQLLMERAAGEKKIVVHINSVNNPFVRLILKNYNFPYLIQFHSKSFHPSVEQLKLRKNFFANLYYFKSSKILSDRECYYVYNNIETGKSIPRAAKSAACQRLFMGIDFDKFKKNDKVSAKERLNVYRNRKTILMASRFTKGKQIDKILNILVRLSALHDFYLIVCGHGELLFEKYLHELAEPILQKKMALFPGYLVGEDLLNTYSAADLFISASMAEGGPVSVMKAIACETPIMCTRVGGVDDILEEHNAGILVDPFDYEQWEQKLKAFLEGRPVQRMDREAAKVYFHWPNIAQEFIRIYKQLSHA